MYIAVYFYGKYYYNTVLDTIRVPYVYFHHQLGLSLHAAFLDNNAALKIVSN